MVANAARGLKALFTSTLGIKVLMALTGLGMVGFLVIHVSGNALALTGNPEHINAYAKKLKDLGPLLWVARGGLLAMFLAHLVLAFKLSARNAAARPVGYHYHSAVEASWTSRHMIYTGIAILAFVLLHLAHYTLGLWGAAGPAFKTAFANHDVYRMVVLEFSNPAIAGLYVVAMSAMLLHIWHGFGSLWRSLGASHPKLQEGAQKLSMAVAALLFLGFCAVPTAVLFKLIK